MSTGKGLETGRRDVATIKKRLENQYSLFKHTRIIFSCGFLLSLNFSGARSLLFLKVKLQAVNKALGPRRGRGGCTGHPFRRAPPPPTPPPGGEDARLGNAAGFRRDSVSSLGRVYTKRSTALMTVGTALFTQTRGYTTRPSA